MSKGQNPKKPNENSVKLVTNIGLFFSAGDRLARAFGLSGEINDVLQGRHSG